MLEANLFMFSILAAFVYCIRLGQRMEREWNELERERTNG